MIASFAGGNHPIATSGGEWNPLVMETVLTGFVMMRATRIILPAAKRRRLIFGAVLRGVLAAVVLVVLYYVLPLDRPWDSDTAIRLLVGIVVFAGVMVWQVRAIAGSRYPGLRAAETLGLILPLFLVLFASTYFVMERASAGSFTEPLTRCPDER